MGTETHRAAKSIITTLDCSCLDGTYQNLPLSESVPISVTQHSSFEANFLVIGLKIHQTLYRMMPWLITPPPPVITTTPFSIPNHAWLCAMQTSDCKFGGSFILHLC